MTTIDPISVGVCEVGFFEKASTYAGKSSGSRSQPDEMVAKLRRFKVESSDELELIAGLLEWPNGDVEVRPLQLLGGLQKHSALDNRGGMSVVPSRDGKWLAPLRVLKFNSERRYFTLHSVAIQEIDALLGHSFSDFLLEIGALRVGSRQVIDGETSRVASQLAMVIEPGDLLTLAVAYTVTRPLAVIHDFGVPSGHD